ncbi:hypothetical protein VZQ01_31090 [Myxococcus faecalis]|jgi:hypothetical protein|uniref:hypothetical protein n=1 Tax=Myxococcus TaxID=32 RepID=UPI001CC0B8DB|nr:MULTISPECIES: hypothetical protein [unclassified Myxococcus]MBZ4394882.1 hypothetical protein [Myxococcus sp. AS-1-15]MBZ4406665.1 hypothetical protein [Myxococcus sp. XM-1-1-1]
MKKVLLLVPLLLGVAACRHIETVPSTEQIQRKAPKGALVRVILRDRANPQRLTTYVVDVSRNEIVAQSNRDPSSTRGAQGETSSEKATTDGDTSAMQSGGPLYVGDVELLTDCVPQTDKEGCLSVADLHDGDPGGASGGGGDPTGHQQLVEKVKRLAALTYWSTLEVGIPTVKRTAAPGRVNQ